MAHVIRFSHVNLVVDDLAAARDFYGRVLGLEEIPRAEGARRPGAWFRVGDQELHLSQVDEPAAAASDRHFAVEVADLDGLHHRLAQANAPLDRGRPLPGMRRLFTRDPAGNRIELQERD